MKRNSGFLTEKVALPLRKDGSQTPDRWLKEPWNTQQIELPKSNVLKFRLEGNSLVVIRPSGTEPKLKVYISVSAGDFAQAQKSETELMEELERNYLS